MAFLKKINKRFSTRKNSRRVLLCGLDNCGKPEIMAAIKSKTGQNVPTIPSIGFNTEMVRYKNVE